MQYAVQEIGTISNFQKPTTPDLHTLEIDTIAQTGHRYNSPYRSYIQLQCRKYVQSRKQELHTFAMTGDSYNIKNNKYNKNTGNKK